jgi:hypothetical protein
MMRKTERANMGMMALFVVLVFMGMSTNAMAWTQPAQGGIGYDIYDLVVNKGLQGAIGQSVAICLVLAGVFALVRTQIYAALICIIAACTMFMAPSLVQSFGFLVA